MKQLYEKADAILKEIGSEIEKNEAGNQAAGTRLRKRCQELKAVLSEIRAKSMAIKN